jgi:ribose 5-phosphate isomerase B
MGMAANKHRGIRAAICSDTFSAAATRLHNNANVLCFGARVVGEGVALQLVDAFITTEYEGGRHQSRVDMITAIEESEARR